MKDWTPTPDEQERIDFWLNGGLDPTYARETVWVDHRRQEIIDGWGDTMAAVPPISQIIIAGDLATAELWTERIEAENMPPEKAAWLVGSYARFLWAADHCDRQWFVDNIAQLWSGSDAPDEDPRSLVLWREAVDLNDGETIVDSRPLPKRKVLTVYRGQLPESPVGIAWSLDGRIAHKFAKGAGVRTSHMHGGVLTGKVRRDAVLGYMTDRGESEVIVDPADVFDSRLSGVYGPRDHGSAGST